MNACRRFARKLAVGLFAVALFLPGAMTASESAVASDARGQTAPVFGVENLVTTRIGEQDTCKIAGATTLANDKDGCAIKFDLAALPKGAAIRQALLRVWVEPEGKLTKTFGMARWDDPKFDGFKVWQVGGADKPLAACFPFSYAYCACHEWDVTEAARKWTQDPGSNQGLKLNVPLPDNQFEPAWERPYLQVTYAGDNPGRPKQPAELKAFYRAGQVFVTWKQIPYSGAFFDSTYRVYASAEPVTAGNLSQAEFWGEVHKNSQLNYRRTVLTRDGFTGQALLSRIFGKYQQGMKVNAKELRDTYLAKMPIRYNFVIDDTWPAAEENSQWLKAGKSPGASCKLLTGPELSDDTGLFVHTVKKPGALYFAVTAVIEGDENREDFSKANSLGESLAVKIEKTRPVLQVVYHGPVGGWMPSQTREYTYWEGGGDGLHPEPSTPFYFRINVPPAGFGIKRADVDLFYSLGNWQASGEHTVTTDSIYLPPTRLAPFPPLAAAFSQGGWREGAKFYYGGKGGPDERVMKLTMGTIGPRNPYGYLENINSGREPRQAAVQSYYERRALRELDYFFDEISGTDRDCAYVRAEAQGGLLGIHHPEFFAFVAAGQEVPWSAPSMDFESLLVGKREWKLKTPEGANVWDWNDPLWYAKQFPEKTWPFLGLEQSCNYDWQREQRQWAESGYPELFLELEKDKRGGFWHWHSGGDGANGEKANIRRNEAYLAICNLNIGDKPVKQWHSLPFGLLNGYVTWVHAPYTGKDKPAISPDMVDREDRFETALIFRPKPVLGSPTPPVKGCTADIIPWRLQQFKVVKGDTYLWTNRKVATGQILQSGVIQPDARGLLTVTGFLIDRDPLGNKLVLEPAKGRTPPTIDETMSVNGVPYAEFVQQCRNPVLMAELKAPKTVMAAKDFFDVQGPRANPDGSMTQTGGAFGGVWRTKLNVLEAGNYVITVRAKADRAGISWSVLELNILRGDVEGGWEGRCIDAAEWENYHWYVKLDAGPQTFTFRVPNEFYASNMLAGLGKKSLTVSDVTFTKVAEADAGKPSELRIVPRGIALAAGLPAKFSAVLLDNLGRTMENQPVMWKCADMEIGPDGLVRNPQPGKHRVTAAAAGLTYTTEIPVQDKFIEDFNETSGIIRAGWTAVDFGNAPGDWWVPHSGASPQTSLWQRKEGVKTALVWQPGAAGSDYSIQADVFLPVQIGRKFEIGKGKQDVWGVVIRAKDKDNHYRFQVTRTDSGSRVSLIKRVSGQETELAKSDTAPELLPLDWQTNPAFTAVNKAQEKYTRPFVPWKLDRLKLSAVGNVLKAWLNGKELFPDGVKDGALQTGAAGLYAETKAYFDNVEIEPAQ